VGLLVLVLGASPAPDPEALLLEGHAAFARGDYAGAAALYEQAEVRSTDPGRVAFYLAGAKYHLALRSEGPSAELQEAEQLYRCCLTPDDPRRLRALYGLGNCLLHRAGERDAASLRAAVACYDRCLAGDDESLRADARYNREKARLLLLQMQNPTNGPQPDRPPEDSMNPRPDRPDRPPMPLQTGDTGAEGSADPRALVGPVKPEQGTTPAQTRDTPPPGKGDLQPIPDEVDVPPLSAHDAAEHLDMAARRVVQERHGYRRRGAGEPAPGVRDW
jgi:tetratricopeptide (TPR) repeat protein